MYVIGSPPQKVTDNMKGLDKVALSAFLAGNVGNVEQPQSPEIDKSNLFEIINIMEFLLI